MTMWTALFLISSKLSYLIRSRSNHEFLSYSIKLLYVHVATENNYNTEISMF